MVLLDVDVQGGGHTIANDTGAKASRGPSGDTTVENQLREAGATEVDVLSNDLLEQDPSHERPIQDLGKRKLRLHDRQFVAIACLSIVRCKWMREKGEPLAKELVDFFGSQLLSQALELRTGLAR